MEHKHKLRNCQDGKKCSTATISSVKSWIGSWNRKKKDISGKTGNTQIWALKFRKMCYTNVNFLILIIVPRLHKLLILGTFNERFM